MNRIAMLGVCVAVLAAGCGSGSKIDVTEEPAGANCPAGGYRIEADGVVFYSCDGNATADPVAAGEDGNTCFGDAVRVTIPVAGGAPQVFYVCQAAGEADPEVVSMLTAPLTVQVAALEVMCTCDEESEMCGAGVDLYGTLLRLVGTCVNDVLSITGPPPAGFDEAFACQFGDPDAILECFENIELPTECSEEAVAALEADIDACEPEETDECGELSTDLVAWTTTVSATAQLLNCPVLGGAPL